MNDAEKLARKRFATLNIMRLISLAIVMAGIANIGEKLMPETSPRMGYFLLIFGAVDYFLIPWVLKKAWAKQDEGSN